MPDYSKGKIYRLSAPGCDKVYIGSTTKELGTRLINHRAEFKSWKAGKRSKTYSFEILEHDGAIIELIEEFPCASRKELEAREGHYVRSTENAVNKKLLFTSHSQSSAAWYKNNKEATDARSREWAKNNPERYREIQENHREKIRLQKMLASNIQNGEPGGDAC